VTGALAGLVCGSAYVSAPMLAGSALWQRRLGAPVTVWRRPAMWSFAAWSLFVVAAPSWMVQGWAVVLFALGYVGLALVDLAVWVLLSRRAMRGDG